LAEGFLQQKTGQVAVGLAIGMGVLATLRDFTHDFKLMTAEGAEYTFKSALGERNLKCPPAQDV